MTNRSLASSYTATVSKPRRNVPCPSSVCAYVPINCKLMQSGSHLACCASVPCERIDGMNMPMWSSKPPGWKSSVRISAASLMERFSSFIRRKMPMAPSKPAMCSSSRLRNAIWDLSPQPADCILRINSFRFSSCAWNTGGWRRTGCDIHVAEVSRSVSRVSGRRRALGTYLATVHERGQILAVEARPSPFLPHVALRVCARCDDIDRGRMDEAHQSGPLLPAARTLARTRSPATLTVFHRSVD